MTVIVGFCCAEGIVIASDSQMSSGATKRFEQKVWTVDTFAFGVSGNESMMHLLRDFLLNTKLDATSVLTVRSGMIEAVPKVLQPEYDRVRSLFPAATAEDLPLGSALVGIPIAGAPHLLELAGNGILTDHHGRGFGVVGSGSPFAEHAATIFDDLRTDISLHQTKMLAFRIVQDAVNAAGPNMLIGGPIQMATVEIGSPPVCKVLPWNDPEMMDAVDGWVDLEAERFRDHVPPGT